MNTFEINKNILNIIKYGAVIPIIVFAFIMTYILIEQKNNELKKQIEDTKAEFLKDNKRIVKDEVMRVIESLNYEIKNSEAELKRFLKEKVYEAHSIATNIYLDESNHAKIGHTHSKEHILRTIKYALGGMIYNKGRGYIFINDNTGTNILQPLNKSIEGKNLYDYEDAKGYKYMQKIVQTIKNKTETFDKYYWYKSKDDKTPYEKISFYKYFEPYDIAIGTGEYLVDFENELKERMLKKINKIRFSDNGYIFVFDNKGTYLSHFKEEKLGTNGFEVKDSKGNFFIKELSDYAKENQEGFFSYVATSKPNGKTENREKISFVIHFEKWDWVLGAGFYIKELREVIEKKEQQLKDTYQDTINRIIFISLIITLLLLVLSYYASEMIANKFRIYKQAIKKEVKKTIEKDKLLVQQSRLATMGEMISNIAHQWRQPLSVISTASTGAKIQKEMDTLDNKSFNDLMDLINNSSQYLSETIEDFRNFFNPSKLKKKFNIKDVFEKITRLISFQFKNNNIEIISDIDDIEIIEQENELLQVLINILKNAKDELAKKEYSEKKLIFISAKRANNYLKIEIKDNAGGIPIEIIDKVFDPYFTTKDNLTGTGIGLYMSKEIIEKMNGKLIVENIKFKFDEIEYKGAKFSIFVPLIEE